MKRAILILAMILSFGFLNSERGWAEQFGKGDEMGKSQAPVPPGQTVVSHSDEGSRHRTFGNVDVTTKAQGEAILTRDTGGCVLSPSPTSGYLNVKTVVEKSPEAIHLQAVGEGKAVNDNASVAGKGVLDIKIVFGNSNTRTGEISSIALNQGSDRSSQPAIARAYVPPGAPELPIWLLFGLGFIVIILGYRFKTNL